VPHKKAPVRNGKERILDAAEQLFAQRGFYGVSLRDITRSAGVDVALVGYHFGGKRELFAAVFERRAEVLNRERLERLEEVQRAALRGAPSLEAIVNAFTQPLLERSARGGPGWKSYFALVAYVNNSPEFGAGLMTRHFDPLVERFIAVMREALPRCPVREISGGLCRASDLDSVHERLAPYVAAGLRALCARAGPAPRPGKRVERRSQPRR